MYEIHSWFIGSNLGQFLQRGQFYPRSVASVTTLRYLFINYYILHNYLLIINSFFHEYIIILLYYYILYYYILYYIIYYILYNYLLIINSFFHGFQCFSTTNPYRIEKVSSNQDHVQHFLKRFVGHQIFARQNHGVDARFQVAHIGSEFLLQQHALYTQFVTGGNFKILNVIVYSN